MFDRYLTRSDIAKILKVSPKQAGRLMCEMPVLQIGKKQRRVAAKDFEAWCDTKRVSHPSAATPRIRRSNSSPERQSLRLADTGPLIEAARQWRMRHPQP